MIKGKTMYTQEPDLAIEALPDGVLRTRLASIDWENDTQFIATEQVFRLFRQAREAGATDRMGLFSRILSGRLLSLAKGFARRSGIYPNIFGDLVQAAEELSQFVWECLVTRPTDAAYAERHFGKLFKLRGIDFQRRLLAKKRKCQDSIDAMDHSLDGEDPDKALREVAALQDDRTPEHSFAAKQEHVQIVSRLQTILTPNEYSTYVMLFVEDMMVKDIAKAIGVTTKSINNYKNAALEKIQKEFKQ